MPQSKRSQRITISKSTKKLKPNRGLELKQELVKKNRSRLDQCSNLFVLRLYNERTDKLQTVRAHFPPSESSYFYFGKNRVRDATVTVPHRLIVTIDNRSTGHRSEPKTVPPKTGLNREPFHRKLVQTGPNRKPFNRKPV
jgi:hypothetical protein